MKQKKVNLKNRIMLRIVPFFLSFAILVGFSFDSLASTGQGQINPNYRYYNNVLLPRVDDYFTGEDLQYLLILKVHQYLPYEDEGYFAIRTTTPLHTSYLEYAPGYGMTILDVFENTRVRIWYFSEYADIQEWEKHSEDDMYVNEGDMWMMLANDESWTVGLFYSNYDVYSYPEETVVMPTGTTKDYYEQIEPESTIDKIYAKLCEWLPFLEKLDNIGKDNDKIMNPTPNEENTMNQFGENSSQQSDSLNNLNEQNKVDKPNLDNTSNLVDESLDIEVDANYGTLLSSVVNHQKIVIMLLAVVSMALISYVLFGKR